MVDDANLIAGCLDRDPGAVRQLVDRYQHLVYTVTMRVLRDPMDAEESAQDSFIKALDKLHTFDGRGRFSTWLFSIAHRTAISKLRSRKRTGSLDEISDTSAEPMESPTTPDERREQLDRALAALPPEDASILSLFYLEDRSVAEIVTITGLTASNVKVKLHRGRHKLLTALKDHLNDELWTMRHDH